jgi:hypothetical protein
MIGGHQSSPCIMFSILGSGSTAFIEGSSIVCKNTSSGSAVFLAAALASSSASVFFALSICLTVNRLKKFSILQTMARYLSRVSSLAMHSLSI